MGFKHINYLVVEALLQHFRSAGLSAHTLYEDHGLCLEVVDLNTRIITAFHTDDLVEATVTPMRSSCGGELRFDVDLRVQRAGDSKKAAGSRAGILLREDSVHQLAGSRPASLSRFTAARIDRSGLHTMPIPHLPQPDAIGRGAPGEDPVLNALTRHGNAYAWRWRIPYFYCSFSARLQMSGYLRLMEEVVDLFLAARGVSIKTLLDEQRWIPVVTRNSVSILEEAAMEQDLYTVLTVEDVFKNLTYTARIDTYRHSGGHLVCTSTGHITHGYAEILNRRAITLVELDNRMLTALKGA